MCSHLGESYVTQCFNKLSEEFQTTKMECNCKKSKFKMDYPEVMLLKSSKLISKILCQVWVGLKSKILWQYLTIQKINIFVKYGLVPNSLFDIF